MLPAAIDGISIGTTTPAKVRHGRGAEVTRRLEHRLRQALESGVDRDHHERQPQVGEGEDDGDVAEPGRPAEHGVEHAAAGVDAEW